MKEMTNTSSNGSANMKSANNRLHTEAETARLRRAVALSIKITNHHIHKGEVNEKHNSRIILPMAMVIM
jgi:hypothetical protein